MSGKQGRVQIWLMIAAIFGSYLEHAQGIRPGVFVPNELQSSPSQITAMKKSSVWLHWNYTYGGDYLNVFVYQYQSITYTNSLGSTPVELARRTGPSGTLYKVSSISDPISTRIDVISHNSTLVVHNLQFNDSGSNFSSFVQIQTLVGSYPKYLVPVVTLHVNGAPEFTLSPPIAVTVSENSNLEIKVQMDGNPKPSAIFQWSHDSSKDQTILGTQLYPYIYESAYTLNNIPASFCGRLLTTRVRNSVGTSATIRTNVMVLLKLDADPNLEAGNISPGCVQVKWKQPESGACFIKYEIQFKSGSEVVATKVIYNANWTAVCYKPDKVNITNVQLTMSFKTTTKTYAAKVSESPIPTTPAPTTKATTSATTTTTTTTTKIAATTKTTATTMTRTVACVPDPRQTAAQGKGVIVGLAVAVALVTILLIVIIVFLFVKRRRIPQPATKKEPEEVVENVKDDEMHYMEMQHANLEADSNYASLQPQYEEIGKKVINYENVDQVARI